jgi:hypothetical protein
MPAARPRQQSCVRGMISREEGSLGGTRGNVKSHEPLTLQVDAKRLTTVGDASIRARTLEGRFACMLSKLRLATGEIARHAYRARRVGHFKSVHTSIVVIFTILHVIDPRAET